MRVVGLFLAFAIGLSGSAAVLRSVAARNPSESRGALEHLTVHGGQYDLIIVGSSLVYTHFLPELFDARMRQLGHPMRSFSFGLPDMRGIEIDYYLERILERPLPKLKWMLVDVSLDQQGAFDEGNFYKRRLIRWHDPARFEHLAPIILNRKSSSVGERGREITIHAEHLLLNLLNVGEGVTALESIDAPHIRTRQEFSPRVPSEKTLLRTLRAYKKRRGRHFKHIKTLIEARKHPPKEAQPTEVIVSFRDRIRARGVQPLFVLAPLLRDARIETRTRSGEPLAVLDFNDPVLYPTLYNYKLRLNAKHFHYYGAEVYTLAMADRFAAYLEGREPTAPPAVDPVIETEAQAGSEPQAEVENQAEAENQAEVENQAEAETEAQTEAENRAETESQAKTQRAEER